MIGYKLLEHDAKRDRYKVLIRKGVRRYLFWMSGAAWNQKGREELIRDLSEGIR